MDTMVGDKNITELFGRKYNELYNSVSYDKDEFSHYRMRMAVILKCTELMTMLIINLVTMYILMLLMLNMFLTQSHI